MSKVEEKPKSVSRRQTTSTRRSSTKVDKLKQKPSTPFVDSRPHSHTVSSTNLRASPSTLTSISKESSSNPQLGPTMKIEPISIKELFTKLEAIPFPFEEKEMDSLAKSKSKSLRNFFYTSSTDIRSQIAPNPDTATNTETFLKNVKRFFRLEKKFWKSFFQKHGKEFADIKHHKTARPWALVFNHFVAEHPSGGWSYNALQEERQNKFKKILSKFISLEFAKSNTENTSTSLPLIERAKLLLRFLETHREDPYSCVVGMQARPAVTSCISNAAAIVQETPLDFTRHLIELSTLKNDAELARNIRVLSAKLRGVFQTVRKGSIVLVSLPCIDQEDPIEPPETVKSEGNSYSVEESIYEYVKTLHSNLLCDSPKSGLTRAVFARCAIKPTNDNWIGLWLDNDETERNIVWAPVSTIYLLRPEHQTHLANPDGVDLAKITSLVINQAEVLELEYKSLIQNLILIHIQKKFNISEEEFTGAMRSKISFVDEATSRKIHNYLTSLLSDPTCIECMKIMPNILEKQTEFYTQIQPHCIFAPDRRLLFKMVQQRSEDSFRTLISETVKTLANSFHSRLSMLDLNRMKVLDGSRKRHITGWWLKETRRTVQTFLKKLGYLYEAVPKDYTNQPPANLALVHQNLDLVVAVLGETKLNKRLKKVIESLKGRVYPRMNDLVMEFRAVVLRELKLDVTEDSIANFQCKEIEEKLAEVEGMDSALTLQLNDILMDIEYLFMMERLENHPEERVNHPHIVPLSGLVESSIVRLQSECRTVLELWTPAKKKLPKDEELTKKLAELGVRRKNKVNEFGKAPLHIHCGPEGNIEAAQLLVQLSDIKMNVADNEKNTPLHYIVGNNGDPNIVLEVCTALLNGGASVNCKNAGDETPLLIALRNEKEKVIELLLNSKAEVTEKVSACLVDHPSPILQEFLDKLVL